jgi:leucyl-tRNA synthetase
MGVPGHDERDKIFAKENNINVKIVIDEENKMMNSEFLDNLKIENAKEEIINFLEKNNIGKLKIEYRLKDWLISR